MKYLGIILWLLLAIGAVHAGELSKNVTHSLSQSSSAMEGTPSIEVAERSYDLGKITFDRQYEHAFVVKNAGTGVLEIEKVTVG